jgi:Tfp pilus assembly ATPase PilU
MQAGQEKIGTQTLNQSLASLYFAHAITMEAARMASSMRDELEDMIKRGVGVVAGAGMGRNARPGADQGYRR